MWGREMGKGWEGPWCAARHGKMPLEMSGFLSPVLPPHGDAVLQPLPGSSARVWQLRKGLLFHLLLPQCAFIMQLPAGDVGGVWDSFFSSSMNES